MLQNLKFSLNPYLVLIVLSFALVIAWVFEYIFNIVPCALCYYQRYLIISAIVVLATHVFILGSKYQYIFLALTGLILLACAGTAAYQVAVENHLVEIPKICKSNATAQSLEELRAKLSSADSIPCDKIQWSLFGVSMAGYNIIFSMALSLVCFFGVLNDKKKKNAWR